MNYLSRKIRGIMNKTEKVGEKRENTLLILVLGRQHLARGVRPINICKYLRELHKSTGDIMGFR